MVPEAEIEAAERAVWEALLAGDAAADAAALSDDFIGLYPDGFSGKAAHVAQLAAGATVRHYRLSEVQVRALGPDQALIAFRADYLRPDGLAEETMYVASLWRREADVWRNHFSQDTPAMGKAVP